MYFMQMVVSVMIMGYLSMTVSSYSSATVNILKSQEEAEKMAVVADAAWSFHEETGAWPVNFSDVKSFLSVASSSGWVDSTGSEFQFIYNGGTPFSYDGVSGYIFAVVSPGPNGVDSTLASNTLTQQDDEAFYLVSAKKLLGGFVERARSKAGLCDAAAEIYRQDHSGVNPGDIYDLTSLGYLTPSSALDDKGGILGVSGGVCFSPGLDGVYGNGDDVYS